MAADQVTFTAPLQVTRVKLYAALLEWEIAARNGECLSVEEGEAMPAELKAAEGARHLWTLLSKQ